MAARKDVPGSLRMTPASDPQPEPQDRIGGLGNDPEVAILAAGTQALPVDTPSPSDRRRGRPTTGFDKKAYDRQKARERRAAKVQK